MLGHFVERLNSTHAIQYFKHIFWYVILILDCVIDIVSMKSRSEEGECKTKKDFLRAQWKSSRRNAMAIGISLSLSWQRADQNVHCNKYSFISFWLSILHFVFVGSCRCLSCLFINKTHCFISEERKYDGKIKLHIKKAHIDNVMRIRTIIRIRECHRNWHEMWNRSWNMHHSFVHNRFG